MITVLVTSTSTEAKFPCQVVIRDGGWGDANVMDIQLVLHSVANELLRYFPGRILNQIIVVHGESPPEVSYLRGPDGEYIVRLAVKGKYWAQFTYQFAHELIHILARYENTHVDEKPNQWFEESLCVAGSLFALKRMAVTWRTSPYYSNWKSYAPSLEKYADDSMSKSGHQLPPDMTLADWYNDNKSDLRSQDVNSCEARNKQHIVASQLLAIFKQKPDLWESIGSLNEGKPNSFCFDNYLNNWYMNAPKKYQRSIREIIYLFRR
jgi:hypothetical protein